MVIFKNYMSELSDLRSYAKDVYCLDELCSWNTFSNGEQSCAPFQFSISHAELLKSSPFTSKITTSPSIIDDGSEFSADSKKDLLADFIPSALKKIERLEKLFATNSNAIPRFFYNEIVDNLKAVLKNWNNSSRTGALLSFIALLEFQLQVLNTDEYREKIGAQSWLSMISGLKALEKNLVHIHALYDETLIPCVTVSDLYYNKNLPEGYDEMIVNFLLGIRAGIANIKIYSDDLIGIKDDLTRITIINKHSSEGVASSDNNTRSVRLALLSVRNLIRVIDVVE